MKKVIVLFAVFILMLFIPVLAFEEGDEIKLLFDTPVRYYPPANDICSRVTDIIPMNTIITIEKTYNEYWKAVKWNNKTDNIYEKGYISDLSLNSSNKKISKENLVKQFEKYKDEYLNAKFLENSIEPNSIELSNHIDKQINYLLIFYDAINTGSEGISKEQSFEDFLKSEIAHYYLQKGIIVHKSNAKKALLYYNEAEYYGENSSALYGAKGVAYFDLGYYSKAKISLIKARKFAIKDGNEKTIIVLNKCIELIDKELAKLKQVFK